MSGLNIRQKLGLRVRAIRKARGLKQADLAYVVGISRQHVTKIEAGTSNLTIDNVQRIADGLGVSIAVLFDDDVFREAGNDNGHATYPEALGSRASVGALLNADDPAESILARLRTDSHATIESLAETCGLTISETKHALARLKADKRIVRVGSRKTGSWKVVGKAQA